MSMTVVDRDIEVELAGPQDESRLRRLLRENPLTGAISVSLEREPDFFLGAAVEGDRHHTVAVRDARSGQVIGMGSRSVREVFLNGCPRLMGYLSQLRIDQSARGRKRVLLGGYAACRDMRGPGETPFDLTTIVEDNRPARRLLEMGLEGLPVYRPLEPFVTSFLPARRVNPVPRFIPFDAPSNGTSSRGFRKYASRSLHIPPRPVPTCWNGARVHTRGFLWYGVNRRIPG
jgi:hypothetical protein